jgi:hypothetical protein
VGLCHHGDLGDELGHGFILGKGQDQVAFGKAFRQVIFGIVDDQGKHRRRPPGFDDPVRRAMFTQVIHVADAVFPGDDCKDMHMGFYKSMDV